MYDLSSKFNVFYTEHVVLQRAEQNELHNKKDLNIQRLKEGLTEYNEEYGTCFKIVETCVQGSVAMATVVQNDDKNYDIDVGIVFEKDDLLDMSASATREMVADALSRKTKQFNSEPEVKTSCIRVQYAEGYHIDFAVFRREWDPWTNSFRYEHAGAEWQERGLRDLNNWFKNRNDSTDEKLRKVIRLSKMFCKSRTFWKNMPSGLLQTVLCDEKLELVYDRIDELFYYTMKAIVDRIESDTSVSAPVDNGRNLTPRKIDRERMINWKNRLKSKLEGLDILFKDDCSEINALQAWYGFFNHDFWAKKISEASNSSLPMNRAFAVGIFNDTEEFIEEMFSVDIQYYCKVGCYVSGDGWRDKRLIDFLSALRKFIPHNFKVRCIMINTNCPGDYSIYWKVKNVGPEAERRDMIRGQILERGKAITETTNFYGNHYIECYIVKDNVCVARTRTNIPIGWK